MKLVNRRTLLTAAAVIAVPPALPSVTAASPAIDPVHAAIDTHRAAWSDFNGNCTDLADEGTPQALAEESRLSDVDETAALALAAVVPTTRAGAIALLRYAATLDSQGYKFLNEDEKELSLLSFVSEHVADYLEQGVQQS